jgi:hypothetical protein
LISCGILLGMILCGAISPEKPHLVYAWPMSMIMAGGFSKTSPSVKLMIADVEFFFLI